MPVLVAPDRPGASHGRTLLRFGKSVREAAIGREIRVETSGPRSALADFRTEADDERDDTSNSLRRRFEGFDEWVFSTALFVGRLGGQNPHPFPFPFLISTKDAHQGDWERPGAILFGEVLGREALRRRQQVRCSDCIEQHATYKYDHFTIVFGHTLSESTDLVHEICPFSISLEVQTGHKVLEKEFLTRLENTPNNFEPAIFSVAEKKTCGKWMSHGLSQTSSILFHSI